jgi:hypothetical protein
MTTSKMNIDDEIRRIRHQLDILDMEWKKQKEDPNIEIISRYLSNHMPMHSITQHSSSMAKEILEILKCKHDGQSCRPIGADYRICGECRAQIPCKRECPEEY